MSNQRLSNFEVLRVLAMFLIVTTHFYGHGISRTLLLESEEPLYSNDSISTINLILSRYILLLCSVGVNIFVLITGYFLYDRPPKSYRFIRVWFQALFYGLFFVFIFFIFGLANNRAILKGVLISLFPLGIGNYWFVRQYLGLMIVSPFLSLAIMNIRKKTCDLLMIVIMITGTTILFRFPFGFSLEFNNGFSFVWFVYLYITGCYIRRFNVPQKIFQKISVKNFVLLTIIIWLVSILISKISMSLGGGILRVPWYYNGISFYLSVMLFIIFKEHKMQINGLSRMITKIAPYTFGVYLIHDNNFVRNILWYDIWWREFINKWYFIFLWIGVAVIVFVCCLLIDVIREILFSKLGVNKRIEVMGDYIDNKIYSYIR